MAESEEQIDFRRPASDAFDRAQMRNRLFGFEARQRVEIEIAVKNGRGGCAKRADFRRGETGCFERCVVDIRETLCSDGSKRGLAAGENRLARRSGDLLGGDDLEQSVKSGLGPP